MARTKMTARISKKKTHRAAVAENKRVKHGFSRILQREYMARLPVNDSYYGPHSIANTNLVDILNDSLATCTHDEEKPGPVGSSTVFDHIDAAIKSPPESKLVVTMPRPRAYAQDYGLPNGRGNTLGYARPRQETYSFTLDYARPEANTSFPEKENVATAANTKKLDSTNALGNAKNKIDDKKATHIRASAYSKFDYTDQSGSHTMKKKTSSNDYEMLHQKDLIKLPLPEIDERQCWDCKITKPDKAFGKPKTGKFISCQICMAKWNKSITDRQVLQCIRCKQEWPGSYFSEKQRKSDDPKCQICMVVVVG